MCFKWIERKDNTIADWVVNEVGKKKCTMVSVDHLTAEAEEDAPEETVATVLGEEEAPNEPLHGVRIK